MTPSIMTLSMIADHCYAQCHYADISLLFFRIIMVNVVMLSVVTLSVMAPAGWVFTQLLTTIFIAMFTLLSMKL